MNYPILILILSALIAHSAGPDYNHTLAAPSAPLLISINAMLTHTSHGQIFSKKLIYQIINRISTQTHEESEYNNPYFTNALTYRLKMSILRIRNNTHIDIGYRLDREVLQHVITLPPAPSRYTTSFISAQPYTQNTITFLQPHTQLLTDSNYQLTITAELASDMNNTQ